MNDEQLYKVASTNLPAQNCPLTGQPIQDAAVMHRDLSDNLPSTLHDMRDDRLVNLMIVERSARDRYYAKLKNMGVVLAYSGGLDSTTVLHWCRELFGYVHCLLFDYGQRHRVELEMAREYLSSLDGLNIPGDIKVAACGIVGHKPSNLSYELVDMSPITKLSASALTRDGISVPRNTPLEEMGKEIPATFVPGRNVYFLTALAQVAYTAGHRHIACGVNALDYSGYPDCRPEFIASMRRTLSIGVFNGHDIGLHAPLILLNKVQIIRLGLALGVRYEDTHSCYQGVKGGCGECDSCQLRRKAFVDLGMEDPAIKKWLK